MKTGLRIQSPVSYSGNSGYITVEPYVDNKYGLVKVLFSSDDEKYMIDFHLINLNEKNEFDSFGHHIIIDGNNIMIDGEPLHLTDRVPSPIRSPADNKCSYEPQPYHRTMHQFCDLAG